MHIYILRKYTKIDPWNFVTIWESLKFSQEHAGIYLVSLYFKKYFRAFKIFKVCSYFYLFYFWQDMHMQLIFLELYRNPPTETDRVHLAYLKP